MHVDVWLLTAQLQRYKTVKIKLKSVIITESRFCFHFSLFHYCFKDFSIFFPSVIGKICLKETYFILRMIRHKRSCLNLCVIYTSPPGPSQTTQSCTHPWHPLTMGTQQNVTYSSCLYEVFLKKIQITSKHSKNYPFNDNQTITKVRNPF